MNGVCTPSSAQQASAASGTQETDDTAGIFGRRLASGSSSDSGSNMALESEFDGAGTIQLAVNIVSLLGFALVIATYFTFPPVRKQMSALIVWVSLLGMLFHATTAAQFSAAYGTCCKAASVVQLSLLSHELYFFALAFHFFYTTKYPFRASRWLSPFYHVIVWVISISITVVASRLGTGSISSYGYCWYTFNGENAEELLLETFFIPVCTGYCISIVWYIVATKRVRLTVGDGAESEKTRTNLDLVRLSLFGSFGLWALVAIPYILRHQKVVTDNSPAEKALRFAGRILISLKGTGSALLWGKAIGAHHTFKLWRQRNWDDYFKIYDATWVLRREILDFATRGIQLSVTSVKAPATSTNSIGAVSLDGTLNTTQGVESVFAFTQRSGIYPWQFRLGATAQSPSVVSYELLSEGCDQKAIFRDFEPEAFHEIRRMSGISQESYVHSFAGKTRERFSEGKSGSFLYYTGDQLYILKTCTPAEQKYLLYILPQYMAHLKRNPDSYLCRYVGCHELIMEHHSVLFIVLTNILNNSSVNIDELYDLKGSWVGRYRITSRDGKQRVCMYCGHDFVVGMSKEVCVQNPVSGHGHAEFVVGKDLNWNSRRLGLPLDLADRLGSQLYADTEFLQRMNSMDYSLVIGLSRTKTFNASSGGGCAILSRSMRLEPSSASRDGRTRSGPQPYSLAAAAVLAEANSEDMAYIQAMSPQGFTYSSGSSKSSATFPADGTVVNMGIIDILTPWSFRKSIEHWLRVNVQCRDANGISCIKPTLYAERFRRKVIQPVVFGRHLGRSRRNDPHYTKPGEFISVDFTSISAQV
jgi:1-phosphatidylinositol-4-phosphate 5-kinase